MEDIALQSLQILYTFVSRAEIATIFGPKMVSIIQNLRTLRDYIFRIVQHFATKLCNFTHFSMLSPGIYFFCQDKKLVYNGNCLFAYFNTYRRYRVRILRGGVRKWALPLRSLCTCPENVCISPEKSCTFPGESFNY